MPGLSASLKQALKRVLIHELDQPVCLALSSSNIISSSELIMSVEISGEYYLYLFSYFFTSLLDHAI